MCNTSKATVSPIVGIGGSVASESTCVAELWVAKKVTIPMQEAWKTQHIKDNNKMTKSFRLKSCLLKGICGNCVSV